MEEKREAYDQLGRPITRSSELFRLTPCEWRVVQSSPKSPLEWVRRDDETGGPITQNKRSVAQNAHWQLKPAVLRASQSVVGIISYDVPAEMTRFNCGSRMKRLSHGQVFKGSGTVIERQDVGDNKFQYIIITTANLFTRTNGFQPADIEVDVFLADGRVYKGEVLTCDFHYNLAALRIESHTTLQTAHFRDLDDVIPIADDTTSTQSLHLPRHSGSTKICPGDTVIALGRQLSILVGYGHFSVDYPELDCKELYSLGVGRRCDRGGPVINCHGEVIGIMAVHKYFLPSNIVSRWWSYFKEYRFVIIPSSIQ